ncbi:MAG: DUF4384 domain-containing protein [Bryobacterales bacterium]|nr:DUF4384 domain-containing protein [Bryobacterales bacterium]
MSTRLRLTLMLAGVAGLAIAQGLPPGERLTARELFFVPAAKQTLARADTTRRPGPPSAPKHTAPVEVAQKIEKQKAPPAEMAKTQNETQLLRAGYLPADLKPLGLRYTIIKRVGGNAEEVPVDTVFRSGDRIQVAVEANEAGYLYIIARGSSGAWKPLFPSAEAEGGKNYIPAGKVTTIPAGYVFTFDDQAGEEKLFVVFSRKPEPSLESLIYDLGTGKGNTAPASAPKPSKVTDPEPADEGAPKVLLASNRVDIRDDVVGNMRRVYARDLIVEKVQTGPGASSYSAPRPLNASYEPSMQNAAYVVNPSSSADARVVADVSLVHK